MRPGDPTEEEVGRVLSTLRPAFGEADAAATAPTEREVRAVVARRPGRARVRWGWVAGGVLLTGGAFAAGWTVEEGWWPSPAPSVAVAPVGSPRPAAAPVPAPAEVVAPAPEPSVPAASPAPVTTVHQDVQQVQDVHQEHQDVQEVHPEAPALPALPVATVAGFPPLLARFEAGERTDALRADLEAWAAGRSGPLADEAARHAVELRALLDPPDAALAAIDRFAAAHPAVPWSVAVQLRADVLRGRQGDCAGALPLYRLLTTAPDPRLATDATAWQGLCAASVGMDGEAVPALRNALERGVRPPLRDDVIARLREIGATVKDPAP